MSQLGSQLLMARVPHHEARNFSNRGRPSIADGSNRITAGRDDDWQAGQGSQGIEDEIPIQQRTAQRQLDPETAPWRLGVSRQK
jgi:hypothetical protein